MQLVPYDCAQKQAWDDFVRRSKNGTFLLHRDYMDYHSDRFDDRSMIVREDDGRIVALFPAHAAGDLLASHQGLTYGGFVVDDTMKTPTMLEVFDALLTQTQAMGFRAVLYKTIPHIYHRIPAEEDRYALFLCDASVVRRGILTVVSGSRRVPFQERRQRGAKKALRFGLTVRDSDDYETFWEILTERLWKGYRTRPVHSCAEIRLLRSRFPENIRLYECFDGSGMLAGVVVFETELVAHVQYIAASNRGRELCALDGLFWELLSNRYASKPVFDFGTADEESGRRLNVGLVDQKEGFGARAVAHDHYRIDLENWRPGRLKRAMDATHRLQTDRVAEGR